MAQYHQHTLFLLASGDWDGAHRVIQSFEDSLSCQVHGYLHRIEGDETNAAYWYHRAGMATPTNSLADEHQRLSELS